MKSIALRVVSSGLFLPCIAGCYYRWSPGIMCALLVAFAFANFVDGYESAQAMMRKVWKLPK
jgi:hypothetical protein